MSDASSQNLKVSREGIVLIKSFEGFRPRAIPRADGGWIIGYGHTLSAREGASVSEADAELLLRYDLLPVEKAVNESVRAAVNQHQFDALISFAFSVGIDRFATSDVLQRLMAGQPAEAADAMIGWPEPALPETALRRRAAERALFVAEPGSPVSLADLLVSPLPLPAVVELPVVVAPEPHTGSTLPIAQAATDRDASTITPVFGSEPRLAAVSALLGEPQIETRDMEASSRRPREDAEVTATASEPHPEPEPLVPAGPTAAPDESVTDSDATADDVPAEATASVMPQPASSADAPEGDEPAEVSDPEPVPVETLAVNALSDIPAMTSQRYSPYAAAIVGPLPYLSPAGPVSESVEPLSIAHSVTTASVETPPLTEPSAAAEAVPTPTAPDVRGAELVLTPLEDASEPAFARPLWDADQREEPEAAAETSLFGEDLTLTRGGSSILRHEIEMEAPARFDWSETGAFVIMGAVGLTSFGASMAAFRLASEQSGGGNETTIIAWVLAVIGGACVGLASFNLYRRLGLPGGD